MSYTKYKLDQIAIAGNREVTFKCYYTDDFLNLYPIYKINELIICK